MSLPLPERIIINDDILFRHYRRIEECRTIVSDAAKVAITPTFEPSMVGELAVTKSDVCIAFQGRLEKFANMASCSGK